MNFANPAMLLLLGVIPLVIVLQVIELLNTRKVLARFGFRKERELKDVGYLLRWFLASLAILTMVVSIILALAKPYWGETYVEEELSGMELSILVDVSRSMLANDIKPNRLERAKELVSSLVSDLPDLPKSLIFLKGSGRRMLPLTRDNAAFEKALAVASPDLITNPGSHLYEGLLEAIRSFPDANPVHRSIVIYSDGGTGDFQIQFEQALRLAADRGILVVFVGIGTLEGGTVPTSPTSPVFSLDEAVLSALLKRTQHLYIGPKNVSQLSRLSETIRTAAAERSSRGFRLIPTPRSNLFVLLAAVSFLVSVIIRRIRWRSPWV